MTDDTTTDNVRDEADTTRDGEEQTRQARHDEDRDDRDLGDGGKRALEAERRNAKAAQKAARDAEKRAQELEAKIAEFERSQMNDQERLAAERDDWRKKYEEQSRELAARELDVLRRDVAAEKGLPAGMARRLDGTTREELETDADDLAAMLARAETVTAQVPRAPKPDPSQGVSATPRASTVSAVMEKYMAERGNTTTK